MTGAIGQDPAVWEGIRKTYSDKISKLESRETNLRCRVEALEKLIDKSENACLCGSKKKGKSSPSIDFQFPLPLDPCGCNKNKEVQPKKADCGCSNAKKEEKSECPCNPCAYKAEYNESCLCEKSEKSSGCSCDKPQPPKCSCSDKPAACTCNVKPPTCTCTEKEKEPPKCNCAEIRLQELLSKIEQSAPEILAADVKIPKGMSTGKAKCHCDGELEEVLKTKIMPIIDEMLEDFCSSCEDVQQVYDPITSKHNCSCLSMLDIKGGSNHGSNCLCASCICSPCAKLGQSSKGSNLRSSRQRKRSSSGSCVCGDRRNNSSTKTKHPPGCECLECVCDPCQACDEPPHPDACDCLECTCDKCFYKEIAGSSPHPASCDCKECECDTCPLKEGTGHPQDCECVDCVCEKCSKLGTEQNKATDDCACGPASGKSPTKPKPKQNAACGCGPKMSATRGKNSSKIPVPAGCACSDPCPCDPCYFDPKAIDDLVKGDGSSICACPKPKRKTASRKKPGIHNQSSNLSLKSADIEHMKDIIDMFNKQKVMKRRIEELERKEQAINKRVKCKC